MPGLAAREDRVDLSQLLGLEFGTRRGLGALLDLFYVARAYQRRRHYWMPQHPTQCHLGQALSPRCRYFL